MARNNVLNRGALYNLLGTGIPLLVGLISVPILLKSLGNQTFGLLTLIWTAIGYFGLFDFGIGRALSQQEKKPHNWKIDLSPSLIPL